MLSNDQDNLAIDPAAMDLSQQTLDLFDYMNMFSAPIVNHLNAQDRYGGGINNSDTNEFAEPITGTNNRNDVPNVGAIQDDGTKLVGATMNAVQRPLPLAVAAPPATINTAAPFVPTCDLLSNTLVDYIDRVEKKEKTLAWFQTFVKFRTQLDPPVKPYHCKYWKRYNSPCGMAFETMEEALVHVGSHLKNVTKICRLWCVLSFLK
ncbi:hypothetical protein M422DRAFT_273769 [Sphaerobolus stellatus SS14]|uniref:Uncharacterized protein n=1 Tax=Sphaerobolus stellatus (strain SS14) TaxID=990650 RepID=A0A0C9U878_SPHS4|nr:hypothetical protein M422DRAFT_273769 [Sphaerobolus stellatus SS14]